MSDIEIRYAETDDDIILMHRFLCVVAGPGLPGPIDARDSVNEVWRCAKHDVALMAMKGGLLVGTMGLACPAHWWNSKIKFLANRWFFVLPESGAGAPLLKEAIEIAVGSGLELHVYDETKERLKIFNKNHARPSAGR
jgi:hypothetical protein